LSCPLANSRRFDVNTAKKCLNSDYPTVSASFLKNGGLIATDTKPDYLIKTAAFVVNNLSAPSWFLFFAYEHLIATKAPICCNRPHMAGS
jgi:hypothetical protein